MVIEKNVTWIIMSKDREYVAKGTPRNRELIRCDNKNDKKRYLTYSTKGRAEAAFKKHGFYGPSQLKGYSFDKKLSDFLEAVECQMTIKTI